MISILEAKRCKYSKAILSLLSQPQLLTNLGLEVSKNRFYLHFILLEA